MWNVEFDNKGVMFNVLKRGFISVAITAAPMIEASLRAQVQCIGCGTRDRKRLTSLHVTWCASETLIETQNYYGTSEKTLL